GNDAVDIDPRGFAVPAFTNVVSEPAKGEDVFRAIERGDVAGIEACVRQDLLVNGSEARVVGLEGVGRGFGRDGRHRIDDSAGAGEIGFEIARLRTLSRRGSRCALIANRAPRWGFRLIEDMTRKLDIQ